MDSKSDARCHHAGLKQATEKAHKQLVRRQDAANCAQVLTTLLTHRESVGSRDVISTKDKDLFLKMGIFIALTWPDTQWVEIHTNICLWSGTDKPGDT